VADKPREARRAMIPGVASRYDDELWRLVPAEEAPPPHLRRFVSGLGQGECALDLGCGDGRLTVELNADTLTAADISDVALDRARRRLADRPARLVSLEPDAPLPFSDSSYDLVLCAETIEHVRDVQLMLSEVRRVLRPGGRLALTTPAHGRLTALGALVRGLDRSFDPLSPHLRFFTRRSLGSLLSDMGFRISQLQRRHGSLLVAARRLELTHRVEVD
jgi:ubiquinone/menaquinone biosynthesis C-methylase UbiE